jgi:hypothetical protein
MEKKGGNVGVHCNFNAKLGSGIIWNIKLFNGLGKRFNALLAWFLFNAFAPENL